MGVTLHMDCMIFATHYLMVPIYRHLANAPILLS
jgi:hypothetical protein